MPAEKLNLLMFKKLLYIFFRFKNVEKRLFIIFFVFVFFFGVFKRQSGLEDGGLESPITFDLSATQKEPYLNYEEKLKDGSEWKPTGWGSGEYLDTIPKIKAGVVLDFNSGEVLWSQNLKSRIAPASLTKVATVMTALDIESVDEQLLVSEDASSQIPTKIGLWPGEKLKLGEAISAAMLTSANDATEVISSSLGGKFGNGTEDFEKLVNEKLKKIGAQDSHFVTSTGLDAENHYSTIYDLAIIGHAALVDYPYIADVADDSYRRLEKNSDHRLFDLPNWNALLGTYPGVNGLKIGYTEQAGHATMVTAERDGVKLLVVLVGANSLENREIAAATLLNYGFGKKGIDPYPIDQLNLVSRYEEWRNQLSMASP